MNTKQLDTIDRLIRKPWNYYNSQHIDTLKKAYVMIIHILSTDEKENVYNSLGFPRIVGLLKTFPTKKLQILISEYIEYMNSDIQKLINVSNVTIEALSTYLPSTKGKSSDLNYDTVKIENCIRVLVDVYLTMIAVVPFYDSGKMFSHSIILQSFKVYEKCNFSEIEELKKQFMFLKISILKLFHALLGKMLVPDVSDELCDALIPLLDIQETDEPLKFLENAPLLVDLDVLYDIVSLLSGLKDEIQGQGSDTTRIEYVISCFENMLIGTNMVSQKTERHNRTVSSQPMPETVPDEEYLLKTSLIQHVKDIFPDLGEGYIEAFLKASGNDPEIVIMKILENDIPEAMRNVDKNLVRLPPRNNNSIAIHPQGDMQLIPYTSLPEISILDSRKNIFDGDEFDAFTNQINPENVIFGKKEDVTSLAQSLDMKHKEMILKVAEEYDDEYDDTYDSQDIGLAGTIEPHLIDEEDETHHHSRQSSSTHASRKSAQEIIEEQLVRLTQSNPSIFDISKRKSPERETILKQVGMTNEQFEGWYKMFLRNPNKDRVLKRYEWKGEQNVIERKRFDETEGGESNERSDNSRGRGSGHRGGRGFNRKKAQIRKMTRNMGPL